MQDLVNKGNFGDALKELKGGGSAGNPEGSTPNADKGKSNTD
jgi:hypothetical protein